MKALFPLLLLGIILLLVAGCTNPVVTPLETPAVTPPETPAVTPPPTEVPLPTPDLTPQPTDVVPSFQAVAIQVTKNTVSIDPWVSVIFAGGLGQPYVTVMTATIFRSDGNTETSSARYPGIGTEIILPGTTKTDRVMVNVTFTNGKTYRVKDELVPFQSPYS